MHYFIFELFLHHLFLSVYFPISNAKDYSVEDSKNMLVEYVKNPSNFENEHGVTKEQLAILKLASETPFGLLHFLSKNWKCDKIGKEFTEQKEIEGCKTYHEYVGILYEYLNRLNAGTKPVEPKFYFDKIYAYSTLRETVESLAIIWKFYFNKEFGKSKGHKLETLFIRYYEPKLWNKKELNYEANLVDNSKENPTKFYQFMKEKFKELAKDNNFLFGNLLTFGNFNTYAKLLPDRDEMFIDDTFIAFVRGKRYFYQLCDKLKKDGQLNEQKKNSFGGLSRKEKMARSYAISLGSLTEMNQQCNSVDNVAPSEEKAKLCKYVNILYEYLFQVYANAEMPDLAQTRPAVRPKFRNLEDEIHLNLVIVFMKFAYHDLSTGNSVKAEFDLELENVNEFDNNYDATFDKSTREKFDQEMAMHGKAAKDEIDRIRNGP